MRIQNQTDEPITIEPSETVNVSVDKDTTRTMSLRIDIARINEVRHNGRK